jgi:hypothetical protein
MTPKDAVSKLLDEDDKLEFKPETKVMFSVGIHRGSSQQRAEEIIDIAGNHDAEHDGGGTDFTTGRRDEFFVARYEDYLKLKEYLNTAFGAGKRITVSDPHGIGDVDENVRYTFSSEVPPVGVKPKTKFKRVRKSEK